MQLECRIKSKLGGLNTSARVALLLTLLLPVLSGCQQELSNNANESKPTTPAAVQLETKVDHGNLPATPSEASTTKKTTAKESAPKATLAADKADKLVASIDFAEADNTTQGLDIPQATTEEATSSCNQFVKQASIQVDQQLTDTRTEFCNKISNRLASVSHQSCMAAELVPTGCQSVDGVPLMIREFAPLDNKQPLGRVLLIGGTHGDELTSVSVTFRWVTKLNEFHSGLFHWRVIPAMNPDGLLKRAAKRTNHNGVDLNRNMPSDDWEKNALAYWQNKGSKNPRKYPGSRASSEPETQWLVDEIKRFKPDAIIAVHAPYGVVDFDALKLSSAPRSLGKLHLNLLGTYPGSLGNYAGINLNIPVITLELPS